jgi:four helix bundle protein
MYRRWERKYRRIGVGGECMGVSAFVAKLNDAEAEAAETQVHLEIAFRHSYLNQETFAELDDAYEKDYRATREDD